MGDQAQLRLISSSDAVGREEALQLGLHVRLAPSWKIYWRSPGDAGLPPVFDWAGSDNLAEVETRWPVPHRFTLFGLDTFGYEGEVVLPLTVRLARPGEPLSLRAHLRYLVCDPQICVPAEARLALALPGGPSAPSAEAELIQRYLGEVPGSGVEAGLKLTSVTARGSSLVVEVEADPGLAKPDLIVEGPENWRFAAPKVDLSEGGRRARLELAGERLQADAPELAGLPLTLTLYEGKRAMEAEAIAAGVPSVGWRVTGLMVALALLGGFILNFMPCVLPVLSLKLLGVVGQGGRARAAIRASFLASAAGILFAFLALAALLIAMKSAGAAIGWGIQFQQPLFLAALAVVLVLFAANLFGFFELPLPAWLGGIAGRAAGPGHGLGAAFATGAFATVLATPCSAPFLGTAVGFALARNAPEILLVFTALGIGLALPWLAVAALPGIVSALPRPGRWMIWMKAVLALFLLATAAWLLSVLAMQVSPQAAAVVAVLLAGMLLALALLRRVPRQWRVARPVAALLLAGAALLVTARMPVIAAADPVPAGAAEETARWQTFDRAAIAGLVAAGKTVLVDVTADWCLTCQVNKKLVLDSGAVRMLLDRPGVVAMKADWTRPDPNIASYLAAFGRYGIPFNVVYGPKATQGLVLPEVLTVEGVRAAFERAGS